MRLLLLAAMAITLMRSKWLIHAEKSYGYSLCRDSPRPYLRNSRFRSLILASPILSHGKYAIAENKLASQQNIRHRPGIQMSRQGYAEQARKPYTLAKVPKSFIGALLLGFNLCKMDAVALRKSQSARPTPQ